MFATASEGDVVDISFPAEYAIDQTPQKVKYDYPFAAYKANPASRSTGCTIPAPTSSKTFECRWNGWKTLTSFFARSQMTNVPIRF